MITNVCKNKHSLKAKMFVANQFYNALSLQLPSEIEKLFSDPECLDLTSEVSYKLILLQTHYNRNLATLKNDKIFFASLTFNFI